MNMPKLTIDDMIKPLRLSIEAVSKQSAEKRAGERLDQIRKTFVRHKPPIHINEYRGSGGFSDVFSATSDYGGVRDFAIKILRSSLMNARKGKRIDPIKEEMRIKDIKKRFTNESYVQWDLSQHLSDRVSQSVVKVYDHGEFDTRQRYRFILMERMHSTLRDYIMQNSTQKHEPHLLGNKALLLAKIADIIFNVHQEGIFHRDIKPENIFFCRKDAPPGPATAVGRRLYELEHQVKLGDFGTVRWIRTYDGVFDGIIIGSQWYLSPEQIYDPEHLDVRTDIYSFGIVGYEVLYGAHPKNVNANTRNLLMKLAHAKPVPRTPPKGFEPLHEIIFKCMQDIDRRYQSMGEVVEELRRFIRAMRLQGKDC
ncbi:MAG: serine/threonine protein kinase [Chitinispirillaceae bacterium]|nr:serine/threonine protein kinase [Chitinispirillaceae bacterium]